MALTIITYPKGVANHSGLKTGPLKLPDDVAVNGQLILVGEIDQYLQCFISGSGTYYAVLKSEDENHLYQHILRLNLNQG